MSAASALQLDLDLEPFCGPFDLLLALVLRDVVDLGEVPVADVCLRYLAQIEEDGELDLESASEFLVLVAALLELKIRLLLTPDEVDDMPDAQEAAEELAARLAEYARAQAAAQWLSDRLEQVGRRVFRDGPPALRPPRPQLEDEEGTINLVLKPKVYDSFRLAVRTEPLLFAEGVLERHASAGGTVNLVVDRIEPLEPGDAQLAEVGELVSADFRAVAPAVMSFAQGRRR